MANRVLVVDDEPDLRFLWRAILERAGYRVLEASGGREALDAVRSETPDVVVLDSRLPDLSGWDVIDALAADPGLSATPVIVVTADPAGASAAKQRSLPAERFLTKPLTVDALVTAVRRAAPTA